MTKVVNLFHCLRFHIESITSKPILKVLLYFTWNSNWTNSKYRKSTGTFTMSQQPTLYVKLQGNTLTTMEANQRQIYTSQVKSKGNRIQIKPYAI